MKKWIQEGIVLFGILVIFSGVNYAQGETPNRETTYLNLADPGYAYEIAVKMGEFKNGPLGFSNAGSTAEHQKADFLFQEMKRIGLQNVHKDPFPVDTWEFKGASLTVLSAGGNVVQNEKEMPLSAYATRGTAPNGIDAELVYVGKGTQDDYLDKDVKGKIVLIDIDMKADWWVNFPTAEAELHGAVAVINNCIGGYAQKNSDTLNSQDFCGPVTIPSLNISTGNANYLKELLKQGTVKVNLKSLNTVTPGGTSYNVWGTIPGRSLKEEYIIVGDHYDAHFSGFQDNSTAVGLTLAIAKTFIASGYKPEHTLIFILHGAEEWGAIDSLYDWSIGAWNSVNRLHPEWIGKTLAYINFEYPAYQMKAFDEIRTVEAYDSFLNDFIEKDAPKPVDCYPEGTRTEVGLTTWSDDFAYSVAGIPSLRDGGSSEDFASNDHSAENYSANIYHSQFDDSSTYNAAVMKQRLKLYGILTMKFDQTLVAPLNFATRFEKMTGSIDDASYKAAGVDNQALRAKIAEVSALSKKVYDHTLTLNDVYKKIKTREQEGEQVRELRKIAADYNQKLLSVYKISQDDLTKLDWYQNPIFAHEDPQKNLTLLDQIIETLKEGNGAKAYDDLLWKVQDESYDYAFDRKVVNHLVYEGLFQPKSKLFWGADRIVSNIDLYDIVQSVKQKSAKEKSDYFEEIAQLQKIRNDQIQVLKTVTAEEIQILNRIESLLNTIDLKKSSSGDE
jgi:hypothetical protein